ncbi:hypothetical protein COCC4DRAFT_30039 [Bipolaris maydis ATCC 48331]|uniref:Uncharacterized protein n=2 Tax=Cochliobolus heterostrophus TaxID=5016 RepID=M2URX9_COCH5|nr:uncharacterized protein COCC4DRAFT_30039 [Bipolaris maydis ATCC 48331]EMD90653.1 hypothetical protein COCHEDRAFT_1022468 [Bipolaris maydis C5]KAJ5023544.1 hypothetical protein J3E73DRAFT_331711 [Bipolaris maydis]ENI09136.1 hypothetical protein COCC4DRAFT_30039 [Bipolaris maydis ATCC 48331]KAJ5058516.1 hypothetical protein J3E74DRAFT_361087 [Bipolaris maydis]KAJ6195758.1 hypothetical protein J3E72DRAFT_339932 [Bipolaris maydis]
MRLATGPNLKYTPVYPPFLPTLLICCCILFFFYHLVPSFTTATDDIATLLVDNLNLRPSGSNACTKEIGTAQCCSLFLEATPCLDECRKLHVDRETLSLTLAYDNCASQCLAEYHSSCPSSIAR